RIDPYSVYRRLREEDPVQRSPFGLLVLSRYEDCLAMLRDPHSSSDSRKSNLFQQFMGGRTPEEVFGDLADLRPFLFMDPPDHTRLRGLVSKAFTPKVVESLRPRIQELVDELLGAVAGGGQME